MIVSDALMCGGSPTIEGRRLQVEDLVWGALMDGVESYIQDFEIQYSDMVDAVNYCVQLRCRKEAISRCGSCVLYRKKYNAEVSMEVVESESFRILHIDSAEEYIERLRDRDVKIIDHGIGVMGWVIARTLLEEGVVDRLE